MLQVSERCWNIRLFHSWPPKNGFVQGIISLRGLKVAVINLKKKLEMKTAGYVLDACVLVLETKPAAGEKSIGILADSLQEVLELEPDRIEPASGPEFVKGIGKKDEKYFSIIDIDRILAPEEYETLDETEDETGR